MGLTQFPVTSQYLGSSENNGTVDFLGERSPDPLSLAFAISRRNTSSLISQIRVGGQNLRVSQSVSSDGKLKQLHLHLPLAEAIDELNKCRA